MPEKEARQAKEETEKTNDTAEPYRWRHTWGEMPISLHSGSSVWSTQVEKMHERVNSTRPVFVQSNLGSDPRLNTRKKTRLGLHACSSSMRAWSLLWSPMSQNTTICSPAPKVVPVCTVRIVDDALYSIRKNATKVQDRKWGKDSVDSSP
jgi:hypothetical protein